MNKNGFTLVEVLLAAAVGLIVGTFLVVILVNNSGFSTHQNSLITEGVSLNDAMQQINDQIKQAARVASSYPAENPLYQSSSAVLVLQLPALTASGVLENVYDYVVIVADQEQDNVLRMKIFPDSLSSREPADQVLTPILSNLTFEYLDNNDSPVAPASSIKIKTTLTLLSKTGSIGSPRTASTIVNLRNL